MSYWVIFRYRPISHWVTLNVSQSGIAEVMQNMSSLLLLQDHNDCKIIWECAGNHEQGTCFRQQIWGRHCSAASNDPEERSHSVRSLYDFSKSPSLVSPLFFGVLFVLQCRRATFDCEKDSGLLKCTRINPEYMICIHSRDLNVLEIPFPDQNFLPGLRKRHHFVSLLSFSAK